MKNNFSSLIANEELCNYFTSAIQSGSLSHAYILLGAKGTGKHTLSRLIASALNCENRSDENTSLPCLECDSCKKIMGNISADVIYISKDEDKATLGIDPIRFIKEDVAFFPNDGDYKIYIIEDAHTMTPQAQNAFLLTLEEPPSYAIFILLCEHTETILETIKSRAPILRIKTPSKDEAVEFLMANHPAARTFINNSPDEFNQIYLAAKGSIGRILELINSSEKKQILQNRELAQKVIESVAHRTLTANFGEISAMFSQKRDEREKIIASLCEIQYALRDLILIKKADEPSMIFFTDIKYAEELSYSFSTQQLIKIAESTEKARQSLLRNANIKLTIINYLSELI
jgi:DNA polymerase-3 subunit delta'